MQGLLSRGFISKECQNRVLKLMAGGTVGGRLRRMQKNGASNYHARGLRAGQEERGLLKRLHRTDVMEEGEQAGKTQF